MNIKIYLKSILERCKYLLNDTTAEFRFEVDGHEIIANFSEKRNDDLVPRLKEILVGSSVNRETSTEITGKNHPKKKRDRDAR